MDIEFDDRQVYKDVMLPCLDDKLFNRPIMETPTPLILTKCCIK